MALYVAAMGGLACHAYRLATVPFMIVVFGSWGVWSLSHLVIMLRKWTRARVTGVPGGDGAAVQFAVAAKHPVRVYPGCYFYVYFPRRPWYGFFHGRRLMLLSFDAAPSTKTSDLSFLTLRHDGTSALRDASRILLNGPYGRDVALYEFETVFLVAKGMGIAGVLAHALYIARRKRHDDSVRDEASRLWDSDEFVFRDATRRLILVWFLEHNSQDVWVADQLKRLQEMDQDNVSRHKFLARAV